MILLQDRYYIDQSGRFDCDGGLVNFDHPSSVDFALMARQLKALKEGHSVDVPRYDFATHSRLPQTDTITPHRFIIVDGILIFSQSVVRQHLDHLFYVSTSEELRFQRRLARDVRERGRSPEGVREQVSHQVKPIHDQFVRPSKKYANTIIDNNRGLGELSRQVDQILARHHC